MARPKRKRHRQKKSGRKWSAKVTQTSDASDLKKNIFKSDDPEKIASSLKKSASKSHRRKGSPYQSAMSMLNFYINRAGGNLSSEKKKTLKNVKNELCKQFGRD